MRVKVKCADCGRELGCFVRLDVGKKDIEVEVHACFYCKKYGKKGKDTE